MKRIALLAVAIGLLAAACGGGASGLTLTDGELLVCTDAPYPPFEEEVDGEWTGFDVEVVEAIGAELDLTVEWTVQPFDGIWLAPESGTCDIVASAMTITEERQQAALFSDGYYDADQSLLVVAGSEFMSLDDLVGQRLAVQTGTTGEIYAQENAPDGVELVSFDEPAAMFLALEGGDVAGILQDLPVNADRAQQNDDVELADTYSTGEQYGFATSTDNTELMDEINSALSTIKDNGTYDEIFDAYFGA